MPAEGLSGPRVGPYTAEELQARRERFWRHIWIAAVSGLLALDGYRALQNDKTTLSDGIRWLFKTDTPQGRRIFRLSLKVFDHHIVG